MTRRCSRFSLIPMLLGACSSPEGRSNPLRPDAGGAADAEAPARLDASTAADGGASPMDAALDAVTPVDAGDPDAASGCYPVEAGTVQNVLGTPASPYLIRHPAGNDPGAPTVVFLPGGKGVRRNAGRIWDSFLSGDPRVDDYRVVIPYANAMELIDEADRTFEIVDEVLACYGGDPARVHLGGASNGGMAAFALMLAGPGRFATLLGAPGLFPVRSEPANWAAALGARAVFNGVGERDDGWHADVAATHEALVAEGVASTFVEFSGEEHMVSPEFDEGVFYDFWGAH